VTFNVAIGNADAHARNYSVLLEPDGTVSLAPLYDLIATRCYGQLDAEAPQRINGKTLIDDVRIEDLVAEATAWGLPRPVVTKRVVDTILAVGDHTRGAREECVTRGGDPAVAGAVSDSVAGRVRLLLADV
jgi:serine/threonine-protein kinase HipA